MIFKYVFKEPARRFCLRNYAGIGLFAVCLVIMQKLKVSFGSNLAELFANGAISLGLSAAVIALLCLIDRNFRKECMIMISQAAEWARGGWKEHR